MKWQPPLRVGPGALLGPVVDVAAYLLALRLLAPATAQLLAFAAALACQLPLLRPAAGRSAGCAPRAAAVTLLALSLRSGVLSLAIGALGWPAGAAIVPAALISALLLQAGYRLAADGPWRPGGGSWRTAAAGLAAAAFALRLIYNGQVELMPEEAYYWNYSRHLDLGYLDHPPMVAWLIAAGTRVFGDAEFGVRAGALCSSAIATFFVYRLTRNLFGAASALAALVLMQILPFFFLTGLMMTPDAPLTAAWAAALYCLERALVAGRGRAWWGAGLAIGLGLLSKYTIVLVGLSALIFMLIDATSRRWLRRPEPYAAAALALAVFSPVIWWNAHNGWASFLFQTSRRLADRPQFALHKLLGSALVLLTPTGCAAAVLAFKSDPAGPPADPRRRALRLLGTATLTPLAVFVVFSLRHEVKLDWTGAPWLAVVPLLAEGMVRGAARTNGLRAFLARTWTPTLVVLVLCYGLGLYDLTWGIPGAGYGRHAELVPVGWRQLGRDIAARASALRGRTGEVPLVVGMDRYAIASELAFYAPSKAAGVADTSSGHLFGQVGLMYERWFPPAREAGRTLLLVAWSAAELAGPGITGAALRLDPIEEGVLTRAGEPIRHYYTRVAIGYRGAPLPARGDNRIE